MEIDISSAALADSRRVKASLTDGCCIRIPLTNYSKMQLNVDESRREESPRRNTRKAPRRTWCGGP